MTDTDYLAHYGILGMKWGIRRYQNKDGSLKPKGRHRYNEPALGRKKRAIDSAVIERKIEKKEGKRPSKRREAYVDKFSKYRNELVSSLNEDDVQYGRDYLTVRRNKRIGTVVGAVAFTPIIGGIGGRIIGGNVSSSRSAKKRMSAYAVGNRLRIEKNSAKTVANMTKS